MSRSALARRKQAAELEQLKRKLLQNILWGSDSRLHLHLRWAAQDAAALAWASPYALLLFPMLFEEKVDKLRRYAERQQEMRSGSGPP